MCFDDDVMTMQMTKCTLETYGPSGTLQNLDGLCILPINVLNEKVNLPDLDPCDPDQKNQDPPKTPGSETDTLILIQQLA